MRASLPALAPGTSGGDQQEWRYCPVPGEVLAAVCRNKIQTGESLGKEQEGCCPWTRDVISPKAFAIKKDVSAMRTCLHMVLIHDRILIGSRMLSFLPRGAGHGCPSLNGSNGQLQGRGSFPSFGQASSLINVECRSSVLGTLTGFNSAVKHRPFASQAGISQGAFS